MLPSHLRPMNSHLRVTAGPLTGPYESVRVTTVNVRFKSWVPTSHSESLRALGAGGAQARGYRLKAALAAVAFDGSGSRGCAAASLGTA